MLAKELPELLKNLLIVVERIINRIPLEDLQIDDCNVESINRDYCYTAGISFNSSSIKNKSILPHTTSAKYPLDATLSCGLRRQELITKNKQINTKYTLRRMSSANSGVDLSTSSTIVNNDVNKLSTENEFESREIMQMPLFCLGGSFPHIDSDEESDDEIIKVNNGK